MGYIRKGAYAPFRAFLDTVLPKRGEKLLIQNTTDCTGVNTGALQIAGGGYIAKNLLVGGTITGNLTGNVTGNASSATKLATARTIFGTNFDGTANITSVSGKIETTSTASDSIKTAGGMTIETSQGNIITSYKPIQTVGATGQIGQIEWRYNLAGNNKALAGIAPYSNYTGGTVNGLLFRVAGWNNDNLPTGPQMVILGNGNMGIGITNPTARLHVAGGKLQVDDTTEATTTTDGSLQTDGGLSVAKNAVVGGKLIAKGILVVSASADNLAIGNVSIIVITASSPITITGFAGGVDGQIIKIITTGPSTLTLANESGSSSPANRIRTTSYSDITYGASAGTSYIYYSARWREMR